MDPSTCKTRDDILKFLVSKLSWIPDGPTQKGWKQEFGYRHSYFLQDVWYHQETGRYAFHSDEYDNWNPDTTPNLGMYNSFEDMLHGVPDLYYRLWKSRGGDLFETA